MCKVILKVVKVEDMKDNNFITGQDRFGVSYKFYTKTEYSNDNIELHTNDYIAVQSSTIDYTMLKAGLAEIYLKYVNVEKLQIVNKHLVKADGTKAEDYISKEVNNFIKRDSKEDIKNRIADLEELLKMNYDEYLNQLNIMYKNFKENSKTKTMFEEEKESYKIRINEKKRQLEILEKYLKVA